MDIYTYTLALGPSLQFIKIKWECWPKKKLRELATIVNSAQQQI